MLKGLWAVCGARRLLFRGAAGTTILIVLMLTLSQFALAQQGSPPATPARPTVDSVSHDSVSITWTDPADSSITGYQVLRRIPAIHDSGHFEVIQDDTSSASTSYEDTDVEPETKYVYRVKARNAHGLSDSSGFVNATTLAAPDLTPATPARPEVTALAHDSVTLSWADPGDASITGYQVLRRNRHTDAAGVFHVIEDDTGTADTSYTDTTVEPSTEYVYRVLARYGSTLSARSGYVRVSTPAAPVEPERVWSGVLDVGDRGLSSPAMRGFSRWSMTGSLTPDRFEADGASVQVLVLVEHAGGLYLNLRRALDEDFVLDVGGEEFVGSDSLVPSAATPGAYWWPVADGVLGEAGNSVDVSLSLGGPGSLDGRAAAPPSARFDDVPGSHDGVSEFALELVLEEAGMLVGAAMLRDHVLQVAGGSVSGVTAKGSDDRQWVVGILPAGSGDVTVEFAPAVGCADQASVCTTDGRQVRNNPRAVVQGPNAQARLAFLDVAGAVLDAAFDPEVALHSAVAPAGTVTVTVVAQAAVASSAISIAPGDVDSGTVGHQVSLLEGGQTPVTVTVTATDGSTRLYWVVVDQTAPPTEGASAPQPRLSGLALSGLDQFVFDADDARYELDNTRGAAETTVVLATEQTGVTVDVYTAHGDDMSLTLSTADADPNAAGHQITLSSAGDTLVLVVVTSADSQRQKSYVVLIGSHTQTAHTRSIGKIPQPLERSADKARFTRSADEAVLSSLSLIGTTLTPAFVSATTEYTAAVAADVSQVTVSATVPSGSNFIIVPSDADPNTAGHQVALAEADPGGEPATTTIAVVASGANKLNAYIITVERAAPPSDDATLAALAVHGVDLVPAFTPETGAYATTVASAVGTVTVDLEVSSPGASLFVVPGDADPNTAGHQVTLASVERDGPASVTSLVVVVTAADGTTRKTYLLDITREAPVSQQVTFALPSGCTLEGLTENGTALTATGNWLPGCRSIVTYKEQRPSPPGHRTTGYARFFRIDIDETSDVSVRLTESTTSHHYVLRAADGTEIIHVLHSPDYSSGHRCGFYEQRCSSTRGFDATLDPGAYVLELVQHFSSDGRQREYALEVTTASQPARGPRLSTLTVNGADVPSWFPTARFDYMVDQPASVVTIAATAEEHSPAHLVSITPADADEITAGHQVNVPVNGSVAVTATVTTADALTSVDYTLEIYSDIPADTGTDATVAADGTPSVGNIYYPGDRDWFAATLDADSLYRVDIKGNEQGDGTLADPYLIGVYDAGGAAVAGTDDDDSGTGANSRKDFRTTTAGVYYIAASGGDSRLGTYTVTLQENEVEVLETASVDFPDTLSTPGRLVVGRPANGFLQNRSDKDRYGVHLEAGEWYRIDLRGVAVGTTPAALDLYLNHVYRPDGTRTDNTYDYAQNYDDDPHPVVYVKPRDTGTHYVALAYFVDVNPSPGNWVQRAYEITVTHVPMDDDIPGDTSTTEEVNVGGFATGEIEVRGDRDWFAVPLEADTRYNIELKGFDALNDPTLYGVYRSDGSKISGTSNSGYGDLRDAVVSFVPDATGTYYVSAGGAGNKRGNYFLQHQVGPYRLAVSLGVDDFSDDTSTTGTVSVGNSATGVVDYIDDRDWFAVELEADVTYRIDVTGATRATLFTTDPEMHGVHDSTGAFIPGTADDNGGPYNASRSLFTPDAAGTYYLSAGTSIRSTTTWNPLVAYRVSVSVYADDYDAATSTTGEVQPDGQAVDGEIEIGDDVDWLAIDLTAGTTYEVWIMGSTRGGAATGYTLGDSMLKGIYDSTGSMINGTFQDNGGPDYDALMNFTPTTTGTFYLAVEGKGTTSVGTYGVLVTTETDDYAADTTTTGSVTVGGSARGEIERFGDRDWFAVTLVGGTAYQIDLEGVATDAGTLGDPYLFYMHRANGDAVNFTQDDNSGEGTNSRVQVTFGTPGSHTYYISVGGAPPLSGQNGGSRGTYKLSVTLASN